MEVMGMKNQKAARSNDLTAVMRMLSFAIALLFFVGEPAFAGAGGGFDKITENANLIQTMLKAIAIVVVTLAIMVAGYKIIFSGARFQDVWGILLGGTLIGGASGLAAWIATPDA
jgi:type IV secretion system protein VirB2